MKIVINECYGGFGLSEVAKKRYIELAGSAPKDWYAISRTDKHLVQVVENLGNAANGICAYLRVHDIEAGCWYRIEEYGGREEIKYMHLDNDWQLAID